MSVILEEVNPSPWDNEDPIKAVAAESELIVNGESALTDATSAQELLGAMWRSPGLHHQLGILDRQTNRFQNIPVTSVVQACQLAVEQSAAGAECFFACGEFETPGSRKADNAAGACAFWVDIDCGDDKADDGKGYRNLVEARDALAAFCQATELPAPTHVVESGGGIHAYWALDGFIPVDPWKAYGRKLKELAKSAGLLADPTRTADIASVLRVPGTQNHKYEPSRAVTLTRQGQTAINSHDLLAAIDDAHSRLCVRGAVTAEDQSTPQSKDSGGPTQQNYGPPDLTKLASALKFIDPDCDDATWKLHRLAPLARTARENPELAGDLRQLAAQWSSGELGGRPSKAWTTPGRSNGIKGQDAFAGQWARFVADDYAGKSATLGTIYFDARKAGWTYGADQVDGIAVTALPNAVGGDPQPAPKATNIVGNARAVVEAASNEPFPICETEVVYSAASEPAGGSIARPRLPDAAVADVRQSVNGQGWSAVSQSSRLPSEGFPDQPREPKGALPCTLPNLRHMLKQYGIVVRYNVVKKKIRVVIPDHVGSFDNADNVALTKVVSLAIRNGLGAGQVPAYIEAIADENLYNPAADWILSKPWDGIDRLPAIYGTLETRAGFPEQLKRALIYRWLLSLVAAALKASGFKGRGVLTLQGPQGIGKTSWVMSLVDDPLLRDMLVKVDHHLDPSQKDSILGAMSHWLVEIGELDSSFRKDMARLKGVLTSDSDKIRRPYARTESEYPRRTVFMATVNEANFLVDHTGNSRWWTLPVVKAHFNHGINMQQLFAQLAVDYRAGVQWWLTPEEETQLAQRNERHRSLSAVEELLLARLDLQPPVEGNKVKKTALQVLAAAGIERPSNQQCKDANAFLRRSLGEPRRIKGLNYWMVALREVALTASEGPSDAQEPDDDGS